MKVDLVIWTLNGEATITRCLDSIEKAVPASVICHRYLIDGGSVDALGSTPLIIICIGPRPSGLLAAFLRTFR